MHRWAHTQAEAADAAAARKKTAIAQLAEEHGPLGSFGKQGRALSLIATTILVSLTLFLSHKLSHPASRPSPLLNADVFRI